jgi:hypothetical protein
MSFQIFNAAKTEKLEAVQEMSPTRSKNNKFLKSERSVEFMKRKTERRFNARDLRATLFDRLLVRS